jgi:hypothetical protein
MLRHFPFLLVVALVCGLPGLRGLAQTHERDPLSDKEIDEMRDTADFPNKRVELMLKFARARMASIDELRADSKKAKDRPQQIHDLLEDFATLVDEIDDNVEMYASHKTDMRTGLKLLIEADSEWQISLRRLKEQSPPEELEQYSFVLANTIDSVSESATSSRETLQEQIELAKDKKLNKVYTERPD